MPINRDLSGRGSRGREDIMFAVYSPTIYFRKWTVKRAEETAAISELGCIGTERTM
jgi:hypothetical protein